MDFKRLAVPYYRSTFAEYSAEALTAILTSLASSVAGLISFRVTLRSLPQDLVMARFGPDATIEFVAPAEFASSERRDFFTNRWLSAWPVFAAAKLCHPTLHGACPLRLDDRPSGPGLAYCGNSTGQVLIPDQCFLESVGYAAFRAQAKKEWVDWGARQNKVFWRGASTGLRDLSATRRWQDLPRSRLCLITRDLGEMFDVGISRIVQLRNEDERSEILSARIVRDEVPNIEFIRYRFTIDIDGNTSSWTGLFSKLIMGNAILKIDSAAGYRQWYYERLIPWRNFIPISESMEELPEVAAELALHPFRAHRIASAARALADELSFENVIKDGAETISQAIVSWQLSEFSFSEKGE